MARPPVPEESQCRGRDLLRRMAEANRPWLDPTPQGVKTYEYRFRIGEDEGRTFQVGSTAVTPDVRRGISYGSALRYLTAKPEGVAFRLVDVSDDRITLAYALKEPVGVRAGNGVQNTWRGFFSMGIREGVLILDARRLTPLEIRSQGLRASFSQYVEIEPGRIAPLAIRIKQGETEEAGMRFDWTFQIVEPKLWLFAASVSDTGQVVARLDQVRVNGAEAKPIARGEGRAAEPE